MFKVKKSSEFVICFIKILLNAVYERLFKKKKVLKQLKLRCATLVFVWDLLFVSSQSAPFKCMKIDPEHR